MNAVDALSILKSHRAELNRRGVSHAALFGSTVRGESTADSDLDVLVEIDSEAQIGVYDYVALVRYVADLFPVKVDVANRATLLPHVRPSAERDAVYAF